MQSVALYGTIFPKESEVLGYDQGALCLPWQDLSRGWHTKLYNAIPPFATGLPHLYYSLTTLQNNHICPNMTKITAASVMEAAAFVIWDRITDWQRSSMLHRMQIPFRG